MTLEYSQVDDDLSRDREQEYIGSSSNLNDRCSKIDEPSRQPKFSELLQNEKLNDSDELIDNNTELKFSLTQGTVKLGGITPKNIQKTISGPQNKG